MKKLNDKKIIKIVSIIGFLLFIVLEQINTENGNLSNNYSFGIYQ